MSCGASVAVAALAGQDGVDRGAAAAVEDLDGRAVGVGGPAVAPLHQRDERRLQVEALLGQVVLVAAALPGLLVVDALEHAVVDELGEPLAEQVARAAERAVEVVEAADAEERLAQHEQGPLLPDDLERALDRAVLVAVAQAGLDGCPSRTIHSWVDSRNLDL